MKKKKIICIYQVIFPYRVGVYERLSKLKDYDFELLYGKSYKKSKKINYSGKLNFSATKLPCFYIPFTTNNGSSSLQITPLLFFVLLFKSPDIILTEGTSNLFNAVQAFIYAKLFHKKIIWWSLGELRGRVHKGIRGKIDWIILFLIQHCDAVFTYSTLGENYFISRGVNVSSVFKSVNVIDTDAKLQIINQVNEHLHFYGFNIVFVGAIIKEKNLELLINVYAKLKVRYPDLYLHIIGSGVYEDVLKEYIDKIGIEGIKLYGQKTGLELSKLLLAFDVLVLPGLGGLAISEGMIHSLPVITGPADGTENDLIDISCGFVTNEMTEKFLEDKLDCLISNKTLLKEMGQSAFDKITQKMSIQNYMINLVNCFNYVCK